MTLTIHVFRKPGRDPEYHAVCRHDRKFRRATSTCSLHSAALNLASRLLVGPKAGFAGCQQINLVEVGGKNSGFFEATLKA